MAFAQTTARRIKPAELARELGVSRQAIFELQARGKLPRSEDGLIDVELARHAISSRVHPGGKTAAAIVAPPRQINDVTGEDLGDVVSYQEAKTLREMSEAKMAALKLRQMEGELVSIERVRAASMRMARMLRDSILGIPSRIAPAIASETDAHVIEQIIGTALRRALDDISTINEGDMNRLSVDE